MHVWFCRVVCLRACLLVYQLVCRFVGLLAPCFSFCAMLTMLVTFFCACLCGWVPKDCTNYHMWVPFWGPIGGNLFSHLMLRVSVGWTLRMNTSNSCCSLSPILSRYIPCISTLGCAVKIFQVLCVLCHCQYLSMVVEMATSMDLHDVTSLCETLWNNMVLPYSTVVLFPLDLCSFLIVIKPCLRLMLLPVVIMNITTPVLRKCGKWRYIQ